MIHIEPKGLDNFERMVLSFPDRAKEAMALAINQTTRRTAAKLIRDDMMRQVALKKRYLIANTPVRAYANKHNLRASIKGRDTPTMLARFAVNRRIPKRQNGVKVMVKPNRVRVMRKAWLHDFSRDKSGTNLAVMVRTKNGQEPHGVLHGGGRYVRSMNAWILYAPSIDQLMWGTVGQNQDKIAKALEREFLRQFHRKR